MKKTMIWIEEGDFSLWIAKALAGAFVSSVVVDCEKLGEECLDKILPQLFEQSGAFVGICKSPIGLKKKHGGVALLPYGSRTKVVMKDVVVHTKSGKKDERDRVVKEMIDFMRLNKILKGS